MTVLLFSGGLDSLMAWRVLGQPQCVYVMLGHRYQDAELATITALAALEPRLHVEVEHGPLIGNRERHDGHIPLRNLALLSAAAQHGDTVAIGAVRGESSPDKSRRFTHAAGRALSAAAGRRVRVVAPLRGVTKARALRHHRAMWPGDLGLLLATRSCYSPEDYPDEVAGCGVCMACFRRWVAWTLNGHTEHYLNDPARFQAARMDAAAMRGYLRRAPLREWPAIAASNLDAYRALRLAAREHRA